jgi:hypothetical protein
VGHELVGAGLVKHCWRRDVDDGGQLRLLGQLVRPTILKHLNYSTNIQSTPSSIFTFFPLRISLFVILNHIFSIPQ